MIELNTAGVLNGSHSHILIYAICSDQLSRRQKLYAEVTVGKARVINATVKATVTTETNTINVALRDDGTGKFQANVHYNYVVLQM